MAAYRRVCFTSPAGWLPRIGIRSGTLPFYPVYHTRPSFAEWCMMRVPRTLLGEACRCEKPFVVDDITCRRTVHLYSVNNHTYNKHYHPWCQRTASKRPGIAGMWAYWTQTDGLYTTVHCSEDWTKPPATSRPSYTTRWLVTRGCSETRSVEFRTRTLYNVVMAAHYRVYDSSPADWVSRTGISSGTLRSAIEYRLPLPFYLLFTP